MISSPVIVETPTYWVLEPVAQVADAPLVADAATPLMPTMPVTAVASMPDAAPLEVEAWDAISQGQDFRAEELFAAVLNTEPSNPRARAGYGLAAALSGREATAAWALRDALALRPDALDALPLTPGVRWQLTELARSLESRANQAGPAGGNDGLFLAAAIRAAIGDQAQAAYAMELAARRGPLDEVRSQFRAKLAAQLALAP